MSMKRTGLAVGLLVLFVLVVELILSGMRTREVTVSFRIENGPNTQFVRDESALVLRPSSIFLVDVRWLYRIGPRFPQTEIRAEITTDEGVLIAENTFTIDCGASAFDCSGVRPLDMAYGTLADKTTSERWPAGRYRLTVTRAYSGQAAVQIVERPITVLQQDN